MNENENSAVETEVVDDSVFDAEWEDAPVEDDDMDLSEPENAEATEEPEDQRPEETAEAEEKPEETAEQAEPEQTAPEVKSWKLKHNGEEVDADEAKMVELAQKGLDYDRVREDRDKFKNEHPKYADYEEFLTELATSAGTDIPGLMENVRVSMLLQRAEAEGKTLSEAAALRQVRDRTKLQTEAPAEPEKPAVDEEAQKKQRNLQAFMQAYPDVKAEDIPPEVLLEGFERGDLAGAYARHENARLKKELEELKQSQKNKERSTGSRKSAGATTPKDAFDEAWDSF